MNSQSNARSMGENEGFILEKTKRVKKNTCVVFIGYVANLVDSDQDNQIFRGTDNSFKAFAL